MMLASPSEFGIEVVMRVSQGHRRELLQTLEGLHDTALRDPGMAACDVLEDAIVPNRFLWVEWWPTEAEADASSGSGRLAMLLAAARLFGTVERLKRVRATDGVSGGTKERTEVPGPGETT